MSKLSNISRIGFCLVFGLVGWGRVDILRVIVQVLVQYGTVIIKQSWNQLENGKQGTRTIQAIGAHCE